MCLALLAGKPHDERLRGLAYVSSSSIMWARIATNRSRNVLRNAPPFNPSSYLLCLFVFFLFIPIVCLQFDITVMLDLLAYVPRDPYTQLTLSLCVLGLFLATVFLFAFKSSKNSEPAPNSIEAYLKFIYGCFLKPHTGDGTGSQQDALVCHCTFADHGTDRAQESFYKAQASVYDATRLQLLRGREDMLGLVAAQLKHRTEAGLISQRPVWVDVSQLGWNGLSATNLHRLVAVLVGT
jgi:hypothetical protein